MAGCGCLAQGPVPAPPAIPPMGAGCCLHRFPSHTICLMRMSLWPRLSSALPASVSTLGGGEGLSWQ